MCGINGIVGPDASLPRLLQMIRTTRHRGPDHSGYFSKKGQVSLGHNRLAILDLSPEANQPFSSPDGRFHLVFNGEIYNYLEIKSKLSDYPFKTKSDTEVLLAAWIRWGEKALSEFNGMFSFAIWDETKQSLFAARDRFGVKPFYYSIDKENLSFSSEIKPLLNLKKSPYPNEKSWAGYFVGGAYGYGNQTFWEDIFLLEPGHSLYFSNGELTVKQWYNFEERILNREEIPESQLFDFFSYLLKDATNLRFRADVPVGFNLSGGLDSSMLLSLIHNQFPENHTIEAFSFYCNDSRYDELPYVKNLLKNKPYSLNPVLLTPDEIPKLTYFVTENQQEPFGGLPTLAYYKVFKEARNRGIFVLLDGQGADESWAGYDYYFSGLNSNIQGVTKSPYRKSVLHPDFANFYSPQEISRPFASDLQNLQFRDIFLTKLARALRFSDRVSMANSTELREPFLDYRLVEAAFSLPLSMKFRDGSQKWLFREIAKQFLDPSTQLAPKRPLQTPQREWLSDQLKDWVLDEISYLKQVPWFEYHLVEKEVDLFMNGDKDSSFHIWQWVNTSVLLKSNRYL